MNRSGCSRSPSCILSPCERYRYELSVPTGLVNDRRALLIGANPSTAVVKDGVFESDPTVTRWINYCRRWGYGWANVGNVRAWRATDPRQVPSDPLAIGELNDEHLTRLAESAELIVMGYGRLGGIRGLAVARMLGRQGHTLMALKHNKDGSPAHPLYLSAGLTPQPWGLW